VPAWLQRLAEAAQLAGDRSDLWPAGALAWLAYLGWVPLVVIVAEPDPNDLAFVGVSLYTSSAYPFNVVALAAAAVGTFCLLCGVAAAAQVALLRSAGGDEATSAAPFGLAVLTAFTITLASTLPAVVATAGLLLGVVAVAPDVFQSPDLGTPVLLRLAAPLLPFLVALALAVLVGQAFGGIAIQRAHAMPAESAGATIAASARTLLRRPWSGLGVAGFGIVVDAAVLLFTLALLRVLWAPIATALRDGQLLSPVTLLLLLGFVAIWLALLLVAGALRVVVSAWSAMELAPGQGRGAH
jgi:hypothetical protein